MAALPCFRSRCYWPFFTPIRKLYTLPPRHPPPLYRVFLKHQGWKYWAEKKAAKFFVQNSPISDERVESSVLTSFLKKKLYFLEDLRNRRQSFNKGQVQFPFGSPLSFKQQPAHTRGCSLPEAVNSPHRAQRPLRKQRAIPFIPYVNSKCLRFTELICDL